MQSYRAGWPFMWSQSNILEDQQNVCWKCWRRNSRSSRRSLFQLSLILTPAKCPTPIKIKNDVTMEFNSTYLRHTWRAARHCARGGWSPQLTFSLVCATPQTTTTSPHVVDIPKGSFHLIIELSPCSLCAYRQVVLDVHNSRPVCGRYYGDVKLFLFVFAAICFWASPQKTLAAKFHSPMFFFSSSSGLFTSLAKTWVQHGSQHFRIFLKHTWFGDIRSRFRIWTQ